MKTTLIVSAVATVMAVSAGCSNGAGSGHGNDGGGGAMATSGGAPGGGGDATGGSGTGGGASTGGNGTGGAASTGGSQATGGRGGAGGAPSLPTCLQTLFAACPTAGACTIQAASLTSNHTCFANGVGTDYNRTGGCEGTGRVVLEVHKADGSLCYTNEVKQGHLCEGEQFTWTDAAGVVVATGQTWVGGNMVTCAGGETGSCTGDQCNLGSVWGPLGNLCQAGTCP